MRLEIVQILDDFPNYNHSTTEQLWTIWIPDESGVQMITVMLQAIIHDRKYWNFWPNTDKTLNSNYSILQSRVLSVDGKKLVIRCQEKK